KTGKVHHSSFRARPGCIVRSENALVLILLTVEGTNRSVFLTDAVALHHPRVSCPVLGDLELKEAMYSGQRLGRRGRHANPRSFRKLGVRVSNVVAGAHRSRTIRL